MFKWLRFRHLVLTAGSLVVVALLLWSSPDDVGTAARLVGGLDLISCVVGAALALLLLKARHDYPEADSRRLFAKAAEGSTGAGLALIAIAITFFAFVMLTAGRVHASALDEVVPDRAHQYLPLVKVEQNKWWPQHPAPHILGALIEQESCLSLSHSRCWSPTSRLKSQREEGAGLGQITRAWAKDGRLRFDTLTDLSQRYPALADLAWSNVYARPDLQIRAIVLMSRDDYRAYDSVKTSVANKLAFADAAYNGGRAGVSADRRACALVAGCDPAQWFGHVERTCTKSRAALYGARSACDINREHVALVFRRAPKYRAIFDRV